MKASSHQTIFRDLVMLIALAFVVMVVWMLPHLNPPATNVESEPPGNLIAHIVWPEGNTDVDMWLASPVTINGVGYSNKNGLMWNLLRDDLGRTADITNLNFENAYTRGVVAGKYTINAHCYRCPVLPVKVKLEVSLRTDNANKSSMKVLFTAETTFYSGGTEKTLANFEMDENGNMVGQPDNLYRPIRSNFRPEN